MNIKTYAYIFLLSATGLLALVASINYFVNPYDIWDTRCLKILSCKKTEAGKKIYFTKSKQWQGIQIEGLILGNSRTEIGIDPESPWLPSKNNYNLSIRGASVSVQALYLQNVLQYQQPEYIVLGIDFFSFRQRPDVNALWPTPNREYLAYDVYGKPNPAYTLSNLKYQLTALFSLPASVDSLLTMTKQNRTVSYLSHKGFDNALGFETINQVEGVEAAFKNDLSQLEAKFAGQTYSLLGKNFINNEFEALKLIVDLSKQKQIPLHIFISPVHIEYLLLLKETGHFDMYLEWKKELVKVLEKQTYFASHDLYDFSAAYDFMLEDIPKGRGGAMQWWFEAGHYRPELGDEMLKQIFNESTDFQLSPANVDSKITKEIDYFK